MSQRSSMDPEADSPHGKSSAAKAAEDPGALDLFGPVAHARRTDPATSQKAAETVTRRDLKNAGEMVLRILREHGPMTDERLVETYEREQQSRPAFLLQSPSGIRTRRSELARAGLVVKHGTGKTRLGKPADVWKVA